MNRITDDVHRNNVRLQRALHRFGETYGCGQLADARDAFAELSARIAQQLAWEERVLHPSIGGGGCTERLGVLVRDAEDHRRCRELLAAVQGLLDRSLDGEMGLDRPLLDALGALANLLETHAAELVEPLCTRLEHELPVSDLQDAARKLHALASEPISKRAR